MDVRRVVTGNDVDGRAVFVSDEVVNPITISLMPGGEFHDVWGADDVPTVPTSGPPPRAATWFPPAGGFRFGFFTVGPQSSRPLDVDPAAAFAEMEEKLPGLAATLERDHPGMHTTDTVDWDLVISGEVWLELDDGKEVLLRAGDCVIQNGTRHAWHNRSSEPCVVAVAIVGARRVRRAREA